MSKSAVGDAIIFITDFEKVNKLKYFYQNIDIKVEQILSNKNKILTVFEQFSLKC